MNLIKPYSDLLQSFSFIATIALTFISIYGLKQLAITKNTLKTQSLRDARKLSSDYIYRYLDRVMGAARIKQTRESNEIIVSYRFSSDDDDNLNVKEMKKIDPTIQLNSRKKRDEYIKKMKNAVLEPFSDMLNEMEAFSAVVTSGVLDEEAVYRAVGQNFVNKIQAHNLEQTLLFFSRHENLYTNVSEVYELWNTRLTVTKAETALSTLEKRHNETNKKIKALKDRVGKIQTKTINSIGVGSN